MHFSHTTKYKLSELVEIVVEGDFVEQYLNSDSGCTVEYDGKTYTTKRNYDFVMGLYSYYDLNKREFILDIDSESMDDDDFIKAESESKLEEIFWALIQKYNPEELYYSVVDPNDETKTLESIW